MSLRLLFYPLFVFLALAAASLFVITPNTAHSQQIPPPTEAASDEVIVKYKDAVPETEKEKVRKAHKTRVKHRNNKLRTEVLKLEEGSVEENVRKLKKDKSIAYAEPNYKAEAFAISNDTSLLQQWGIFKINAANQTETSAWDVTVGNSEVKVAILDTGIETTHPDLVGKIVGSANFTDSATVDDMDGHGTHVAGITAAATNNGSGVAGTGYDTVLLNGKVLGDDGSGYYSWITNGIVWAADNGAKVINLSLGGSSSSLAMQDAINYAWSKGVVIVAAAGNKGSTTPSYPGYYGNVIAVAATDTADKRASFSNYGSWVDVAAPGVSIYSTYKNNGYTTMSGTSMATPHAAGTAALIWAKGLCQTNSCVRNQLEKTADPVSGTGTLWSSGRINAYNAVNNIVPTPTPTNTPTPTITPTPTRTPTPTPVRIMTVSNISLTANNNTNRRITGDVTVVNELTNAPISSATIKATITSPSGIVTNFSDSSNSSGQETFRIYSREKGVFTFTVTSITKSSYSYHPTITTKTLLVQ